MKILIFGATGLAGKHVVTQALTRDHEVTAFVRSRDRLGTLQGKLRVVEGDIADRAAVAAAVRGQDAVVSNLGAAKPWRRSPAIVHGVANIIATMQEHGVDRFIYQSALGVGESRDAVRHSLIRLMIPVMLKNAYADHAIDERAIRDSGLAWTIVRPTLLTNGARTGTWRSGPGVRDPFPFGRVARADVAAFILDRIERDEDVRSAANLVR